VRWRLALPSWGQPAADAEAVYVLTRSHELIALEARTGAILWRGATGGDGEVPAGSVVRLAGSRVIVGDDDVLAFDRRTGSRLWRFRAPDGGPAGVFLGDAGDDTVLAGSTTGVLYALDAGTGTLRWMRRVAGGRLRAVYPPVRLGARIIAAFTTFDGPLQGGLVAFDLRGRRLWTRAFPSGVGASGGGVPVEQEIVVARTDGAVEVVEAATGRVAWTLPRATGLAPDGVDRDVRAVARAGDVVLVSSLAGEIAGYDSQRWRLRWRYTGGPPDAAALRLHADTRHAYVPFTDGSLVVLDAATGDELWRLADADWPVDWPPASAPPLLLVTGERGVVALQPGPAGRPDPESESPILSSKPRS
jgi:outer membrane protein assembly factor BamB